MKAARKTIPEISIGNIWLSVISPRLLLPAKTTASNVDKAKITITIFIKLSSNLYFPTVRITMQRIRMNDDIRVMFFVKPKSSTANPAVTIVTAAWIVKIVTTDSIK